MKKLKHIDVLISDNKKQNKRYLTVIYNNKRCKFEFGLNKGNEFLKSLNIINYSSTFKFVSKYRLTTEDFNLVKLSANYYNFQIGGIVIQKSLSLQQ
jgi:hypothetical protein